MLRFAVLDVAVPPATVVMKPKHELSGIEILRFLCACGVLIWHYQHFFFLGKWNPDIGRTLRPSLPLYHYLAFVYNNGLFAVSFFWAISGFIFFWHYAEPIQNHTVSFYDFVVRRLSRLYPLHLATLIFVAVAQHIYHLSHPTTFIYSWNRPNWFVCHLLFASNWFERQPLSFNGPIWSVSVEVLVYLLFFFFARAVRPDAWLAAAVAALFAICYNFLHSVVNPDVFACGMYFFAGGVAQRLCRHRAALSAAIGLGILAVASLAMLGSNDASILCAALSAVIIFARLGESGLAAVFRPFAFLGNATYSSYLIHFPLQITMVILVDSIGWSRDIFFSPVVFAAFLAFVVVLALAIHRFFEMPAQRWLRAAAAAPGTRAAHQPA